MIAMTIGLVLLVGLGYVMLAARTAFASLDDLSRLQENARFAFETMAADIRLAGFSGGPFAGGSPLNVVDDPTSGWDPDLKDLYGTPLIGYEEGGAFPTGVSPLRGDALTVVHADTSVELPISAHAAPDFSIDFGAACPTSGLPAAGEIFVVSDYSHSAVFQIKNATECASGSLTVDHGTGTAVPGNATTDLGAFSGAIEARKLYRLSGATYYIATNPSNEPALFRRTLDHTGAEATATDVEVVEGVEDMQIEYGADTVNTPPQAVTAYSTADAVANWATVLTVRVTLSLVTRQGSNAFTASDGLLRKRVTNTIAVRNRLL